MTPVTETSPRVPLDIPSLLKTILDQYALPLNGDHGIGHWARVLENGLRLAEITGAKIAGVTLFVIFHNSQRIGSQCQTAILCEAGLTGSDGFRLESRGWNVGVWVCRPPALAEQWHAGDWTGRKQRISLGRSWKNEFWTLIGATPDLRVRPIRRRRRLPFAGGDVALLDHFSFYSDRTGRPRRSHRKDSAARGLGTVKATCCEPAHIQPRRFRTGCWRSCSPVRPRRPSSTRARSRH